MWNYVVHLIIVQDSYCRYYWCVQIVYSLLDKNKLVSVIPYQIRKYSTLQLEGHMNAIESFRNTAWKVSKYGVISGPYFHEFGLNTDQK